MCPCSYAPHGPNFPHVPLHVPLLICPARAKFPPCAPSCAPAHMPREGQISPMCPFMCPCSYAPHGPNFPHVPLHVSLLICPAKAKFPPCAPSCAPAHMPRTGQISPMCPFMCPCS